MSNIGDILRRASPSERRSERLFRSGIIRAVSGFYCTAILDTDAEGTEDLIEGIPFSPAWRPRVGERYLFGYMNDAPNSIVALLPLLSSMGDSSNMTGLGAHDHLAEPGGHHRVVDDAGNVLVDIDPTGLGNIRLLNGTFFYDTAGADVSRGAIITGQGAAPNTKWTRLAHPGAGRLLTTPDANDVAWGLTAVRGSILVGNSTPVWSLLANPGAVGSVLISGATDPSWSTTAQLARMGLGAAADATIPLTITPTVSYQGMQFLSGTSGQGASIFSEPGAGGIYLAANAYFTAASVCAKYNTGYGCAIIVIDSYSKGFIFYSSPSGAGAPSWTVDMACALGMVAIRQGLQIGTSTPPSVAGFGVGTAPLGAGQLSVASHITLAGNLLSTAVGATNLGSTTYELGHIYVAQDKRIYLGNAQEGSMYYDSASGKVIITR